MRRAIAVILPLLVLSAASFAQDDSDSEPGASDFLKELTAAADPEPPSASESAESAEADSQKDDEDEDDGDDAAVKPPAPSKSVRPPMDRQARNKMIFRCTAIGLDVLGAGLFAYGIYEDGNVTKYSKKVSRNGSTYYEDIPAAEKAATRRNAAYIVGSVFLASGITIHILF